MTEGQLPSLDGLRCFVHAARTLNFREAAKSVSLTPAAVGQRIKQLEEQLGVVLFHRTTRKVMLSEAGLRLLPRARRALAAARECVEVREGVFEADLTVGTRHELGNSWIVPMLKGLEADIPGLTVHLYFGSGPDLVQRVRTFELDCAVTSTRIVDPKLEAIPLHEERYVFVAASKLLARVPFRGSSDAPQHTLIDAAPELPLFRYWADVAGFERLPFEKVLIMGTISAIRTLVLRGQGLAVLPDYYVAKDLAAKRLVRLMPKIDAASDHFRLVVHRDDPRRPLFESVALHMRSTPLR